MQQQQSHCFIHSRPSGVCQTFLRPTLGFIGSTSSWGWIFPQLSPAVKFNSRLGRRGEREAWERGGRRECVCERECERGIEKSKTAATPAPQKWHPRIVANSFSFPWFRLFCCLSLSTVAATVEDFFCWKFVPLFCFFFSFFLFLTFFLSADVDRCLCQEMSGFHLTFQEIKWRWNDPNFSSPSEHKSTKIPLGLALSPSLHRALGNLLLYKTRSLHPTNENVLAPPITTSINITLRCSNVVAWMWC